MRENNGQDLNEAGNGVACFIMTNEGERRAAI